MPSTKLKNHRRFITLAVFIFLTIGTIIISYFARGYRINPKQGLTRFQGTGLLSATSYPKSAQVYIDDKLVTATEDTLNLPPGEYSVRIFKEGFLPWNKKAVIKAELVTSTDARLFPAAPSLSALTYSGAYNPTPSPDGKKIAYVTSNSDDPTKNGLYVIDIDNSILNLNRTPTLVAANTDKHNLEEAIITWSPDSKNLLIAFTTPKENEDTDTPTQLSSTYLVDSGTLTNLYTAPDATIRLPVIFSDWEQEILRNQQAPLKNLPEFMVNLLTQSAKDVYFSPNGEKVLYTSTVDTTIPDQLIPPLASINSTPQTRELKTNHQYIYDLKEDTNYLISDSASTSDLYPAKTLLSLTPLLEFDTSATTSSNNQYLNYNQLQKDRTPLETILAIKSQYSALYTHNPQWYPTSRHLITTKDNKITIFEYDALNPTTVYSGPFDPNFVFPSPNGDKLLILTNLNQDDQPLNLYTLDLK